MINNNQIQVEETIKIDEFNFAFSMIKQSHWGKNKTRTDFDIQNKNSRLYTVKIQNNVVGFFRLVSDGISFVYLMDLILEENIRSKGIGTLVIKWIKTNFNTSNILLRSSKSQNFYIKNNFKFVTKEYNYFILEQQ
jgi:predicted GNAT family N-acyltransferase